MDGIRIYSVKDINSRVDDILTQDAVLRSVYVKGEVSNVTYHSSGHIYFSIKDESGVLSCLMFAGNRARGINFTIQRGQQIICFGKIAGYTKKGEYNLQCSRIVLDGDGVLHEQYIRLKNELEEMGMFSDEYKKPIPKYAKTVGVVTSNTGAAIEDILRVARERNPFVQIYICNVLVDGAQAAHGIAEGIRAMDKMGMDVIITGRGGGPYEDMFSFNMEEVARAIFECETPIISAVGHEIDFFISDFVADKRAATPSHAAELTVFSLEEFNRRIDTLSNMLNEKITGRIESEMARVENAKLRLENCSPKNRLDRRCTELANSRDRLNSLMEIKINDSKAFINNNKERFDRLINQNLDKTNYYLGEVEEKIKNLMDQNLTSKKHIYQILIEKLKGISPLEKLSKGYAFAEDDSGKPVKSIENVKIDNIVTLYLQDGSVKTKVIDKKKTEY